MGCCVKFFGFGSVVIAVLVGYVWHQITLVPELPDIPLGYWGRGSPKPDDTKIKPFSINISESEYADFYARLDNTREPVEPLEGTNFEYGFNSGYLKKLIQYWKKEYKWSERQAYLNKYPQFKTQIAGLDIHFIHVKPTAAEAKGKRSLPILLLHGWPGSVVEFYDAIPLLTKQTVLPDVAYELVIPSLPGYGWSEASHKTGLGVPQMGNIFKELMVRLGYKQFVVQGGDWGSIIGSGMSVLHPENVIAYHSNMCGSLNTLGMIQYVLASFFPSWLVEEPMVERFPKQTLFLVEESGYLHIQATKPDTIGVALTDSPAGLAAYILEKFSTWTNQNWKHLPDGGLEKWDKTKILDNIMIYWFSKSITTSMRLYSEGFNKKAMGYKLDDMPVTVPAGCARFHGELLYNTESMLRSKHKNLVHLTDLPDGGHFAALQLPKVLVDDFNQFVKKFLSLPKKT